MKIEIDREQAFGLGLMFSWGFGERDICGIFLWWSFSIKLYDRKDAKQEGKNG